MFRPLVLLALVGLLGGCRRDEPVARVFPGKHWEHIAPERVGFDLDALAEFARDVGGSGCVVRYGRMVHGWGHYAHLLDVSSAAKPVYVHLVFKSLGPKLIDGLDSPVCAHTKALSELNPDLQFQDSRMTWRHMVTQTSCYGVQEAPGTAFNYCDYQMARMLDSLVLHVHGSGYFRADEDLLYPLLADLIQCQDNPTLNSPHSHPGRLRISARDFARFGLLYLARGQWDGRQVLPPALAQALVSSPLPATMPRTTQVSVPMLPGQRSIGAGANQEPHLNSYSYTWWVNGVDDDGQRLLPDLPVDTFLAAGQSATDALVVVPALDLVLCWIDAFPGAPPARFHTGGRERVNRVVGALVRTLGPQHPTANKELPMSKSVPPPAAPPS